MSDYSQYIIGWKKRQQREKAETERRRRKARDIATQACTLLKQQGATKIILFGSVLDEAFDLDSDLDVAVDMPVHAWWEWYLKLSETLRFPIDLVHLKKISRGFREIILEFGEVLYVEEERNCRVTSAN